MSILKINVSGNKESYQLTKRFELIDISLSGNFQYNSQNRIDFQCGERREKFNNINQLHEFCEKIRGGGFDNLFFAFLQSEMSLDFVNSLSQKKQNELGLLKSIFLIYKWIELPLLNPGDIDINKNIYNEFIVDWTTVPEPQQDIYFIERKHITTANQKFIDQLVCFNLLACLKIEGLGQTIISYFIPLIKPGLSRENFSSSFDPNGNETYNLWKMILVERDIRINNWIRNRY